MYIAMCESYQFCRWIVRDCQKGYKFRQKLVCGRGCKFALITDYISRQVYFLLSVLKDMLA